MTDRWTAAEDLPAQPLIAPQLPAMQNGLRALLLWPCSIVDQLPAMRCSCTLPACQLATCWGTGWRVTLT